MFRWSLALILAAAGAPACDDTVYNSAADGFVADAYDPTWSGVEAMFEDHCAECHPALHPFDLDDVIADVEGDPADARYVVPGDPEASYMWRKVTGRLRPDDPGTPMPPANGLTPTQREGLLLWISSGAPLDDGEADDGA